MTAYPEVIPKKCGYVRIGDDPPVTRISLTQALDSIPL
jgi:hypothetical protein